MRTFLPSARPPGRRRSRLAVSLLAVPLALMTACGGGQSDGPHLELSAALPDDVPDGTVLRIGDPATQVALELSGLDEKLSSSSPSGPTSAAARRRWRPSAATRST